MRTTQNELSVNKLVGYAFGVMGTMISKQFALGVLIAIPLVVVSIALIDPSRHQPEIVASAFPGTGRIDDEIPYSFCMEGEVMYQLLQGFGSEKLANEVLESRLNCGSRILREEIVGNIAVLDVELECECTEPEAEELEPGRFRGEWTLTVNLQDDSP
jgi:hypothetical protein